MFEYTTDAIVLDKEESGDYDAVVHLYTKDLGKIRTKAKSMRKITSRLSAHLEPGLVATVRIIGRDPMASNRPSFQLVDGLAQKKLFADYGFLGLVKAMTTDLQEDARLWEFLLAGNPDKKQLFQILGFGGVLRCGMCGARDANCVYGTDSLFLCGFCSSNIANNLLTYI